MIESFKELENTEAIQGKQIYLFGHCNATEELADLLLEHQYRPIAILDNNIVKCGNNYKGIPIVLPQDILSDMQENSIVCIVARAYAAMSDQLKRLGYKGMVRKLVDYNSFADYSLSDETIRRMQERVSRGIIIKREQEQEYPDYFNILCPFSALGDIFLTMSYLPHFIEKRKIPRIVVCVIGTACAKVVSLFGMYKVKIYKQKDMDELIQACLYTKDKNFFIAHQDRPYVINLHKALYIKCILLEKIYCCGVFGLPTNTKPVRPVLWSSYPNLEKIRIGKSVIFSPYAKSVTLISKKVWDNIVAYFLAKEYECFTNVVGDETPLAGTKAISPQIDELKSVVEQAGTFVGIRSGLCDVIKYAECDKIALYPDYNYCDTKWKAIDIYSLDGWKNIVVNEDFIWEKN